MSAPSNKAIDAGVLGMEERVPFITRHLTARATVASAVLAAAHDPSLGLDRSVCLRDVYEFVADFAEPGVVRAFERVFGGDA